MSYYLADKFTKLKIENYIIYIEFVSEGKNFRYYANIYRIDKNEPWYVADYRRLVKYKESVKNKGQCHFEKPFKIDLNEFISYSTESAKKYKFTSISFFDPKEIHNERDISQLGDCIKPNGLEKFSCKTDDTIRELDLKYYFDRSDSSSSSAKANLDGGLSVIEARFVISAKYYFDWDGQDIKRLPENLVEACSNLFIKGEKIDDFRFTRYFSNEFNKIGIPNDIRSVTDSNGNTRHINVYKIDGEEYVADYWRTYRRWENREEGFQFENNFKIPLAKLNIKKNQT
ncbi:hypothetical protein FACS189465_1260 [Clostridia bacterium]|nr:hypothetical protein FACS189465_1260 [Clostridia bacterium]